MFVVDSHQYLLDHFRKYDFIWSSPPCQTNSKIFEAGIKAGYYSDDVKLEYHDLSVYQEVLLLSRYFDGVYCIENVEPFYKPLIPAKKLGRHLFWSNFNIGTFKENNIKKPYMKSEADYLINFWKVNYGYEIHGLNGDVRQILRNCVHPEIGLYILNCARNIITKSNVNQTELFE